MISGTDRRGSTWMRGWKFGGKRGQRRFCGFPDPEEVQPQFRPLAQERERRRTPAARCLCARSTNRGTPRGSRVHPPAAVDPETPGPVRGERPPCAPGCRSGVRRGSGGRVRSPSRSHRDARTRAFPRVASRMPPVRATPPDAANRRPPAPCVRPRGVRGRRCARPAGGVSSTNDGKATTSPARIPRRRIRSGRNGKDRGR